MSTIFLHPTRKTYYHRTDVPYRLKRLLKGRTQIWRSLKTKDKDEAQARSAAWDSRVQRLFTDLKRNGERMTEEQRERLVDYWLENELDYAEDCRALAGRMSEAHRESQLDGLAILQDQTHEDLLGNEYQRIEKDADELIKAAGLPALDHEAAEFGRLCRRLLQARIAYTRIETDRWNGAYSPRVHRVSTHGATQVSAAPPPVKAGPLFSVVAEKYLRENPKGERTAKPFRAELKKFMEAIGGDRPVDSITKEEGRKYKDHLMNERKLGLHTVMKHISTFVAVLRWAEAQGYMPDGRNPLKGLAPNKKVVKKSMQKRRPFTDEELLTVLGSNEFLKQRKKRPERWWIVLLCLFGGVRREESAQLVLADIQVEEGIPFIRIYDDATLDQHLKNEGSRRRVPIHSALVRLGFLDYVEGIRKAGHVRLFPDLVKGHNGLGDPAGKWFGRLVTRVGLTDPALVLHSLRHGALTKLHAAGVPDDTVKMLAGHADQTVHGNTYVHRHLIPLSLLRGGLEKLVYPEVEAALRSDQNGPLSLY